MCATAAVGDGATLQPGVDDHRDTALAQLLGQPNPPAFLSQAVGQKGVRDHRERQGQSTVFSEGKGQWTSHGPPTGTISQSQ
jgi:hypothetical protein